MPPEGTIRNGENETLVDERQPLLNSPKLRTTDHSLNDNTIPSSDTADLRVVLPTLMVCAFLAAFDVTVLAAIYPIMWSQFLYYSDPSGSDFQSLNRVSWIAVAFILSNTAFQPLYGRLSDVFGRKPCLLFANVVFLIGTLGCGLAPGLWTLVISRIVAGIGGGGLTVLVIIPLLGST